MRQSADALNDTSGLMRNPRCFSYFPYQDGFHTQQPHQLVYSMMLGLWSSWEAFSLWSVSPYLLAPSSRTVNKYRAVPSTDPGTRREYSYGWNSDGRYGWEHQQNKSPCDMYKTYGVSSSHLNDAKITPVDPLSQGESSEGIGIGSWNQLLEKVRAFNWNSVGNRVLNVKGDSLPGRCTRNIISICYDLSTLLLGWVNLLATDEVQKADLRMFCEHSMYNTQLHSL